MDQGRIERPAPSSQLVSRLSCPTTAWLVVLTLLTLASLALSILLAYQLYGVQQTVRGMLDQALVALESLEGQSFTYEYHFRQNVPFEGDIPFEQKMTFPFEGDIPFRQEVAVPFKGTIPINTTVEVPVRLGLGTINVKVPISTEVYVDTTVPVEINQTFHLKTEVPVEVSRTFHVETEVPVEMTIPIEVQLDRSPARELLQQIREWLAELQESI